MPDIHLSSGRKGLLIICFSLRTKKTSPKVPRKLSLISLTDGIGSMYFGFFNALLVVGGLVLTTVCYTVSSFKMRQLKMYLKWKKLAVNREDKKLAST